MNQNSSFLAGIGNASSRLMYIIYTTKNISPSYRPVHEISITEMDKTAFLRVERFQPYIFAAAHNTPFEASQKATNYSVIKKMVSSQKISNKFTLKLEFF